VSQVIELLTFEIGHTDVVPPLAGLPEGGEDQFETAAFVEEARDGLGAATFFDEGTLKQVGGADATIVDSRAVQESEAGIQVFLKASDCGWVEMAVSLDEVAAQQVGDLTVGGVVDRAYGTFDLLASAIRHLVEDVARVLSSKMSLSEHGSIK